MSERGLLNRWYKVTQNGFELDEWLGIGTDELVVVSTGGTGVIPDSTPDQVIRLFGGQAGQLCAAGELYMRGEFLVGRGCTKTPKGLVCYE